MVSLESEISNLSPFDVLGIEPTDDKGIIVGAYRRMVLLVHPDKAKQNGLKWTPEQCNEAFNQIKKAYKTLMKNHDFKDAPDYETPYEVEAFSSRKMENLDKFNRVFEERKNKDKLNGMGDPYSV
jgi:DnaJ-class molecular chaperone